MRRLAAAVGEPITAIDTPALIVDLDALERNHERLLTSLSGLPVVLRPHAKSHKCPEIARWQTAHGAVGICCQKVSEAIAFADAGISDILVSNQVIGAKKIQDLCDLARRVRVGVCVDDLSNVKDLSTIAQAMGVTVEVMVEIDVGAHRCGVAPGADALAMAKAIAEAPGLVFRGLQAYQGAAQHMRSQTEREAAVGRAIDLARMTRDMIVASGIPCPVIAGGGTGSYLIEAKSGVYTELQVGSYIFMDADYGRNDWPVNGMPAFEQSLFVLTTVMSRAVPGQLVVDAGLKASSVDSGMPLVADHPELRYVRASDEHGVIQYDRTHDQSLSIEAVRLGQKLRLVPGHCDPTVNLYDQLIGLKDNVVHRILPVSARGALL
jgi:D-serine deaminase-like pyridoxal phosphate-dependent protein